MSGPKSDRAVIEARRFRLNELLAEGKTAAQAAEILRGEGFPAAHDTVERDVAKLAPAWADKNIGDAGCWAGEQYIELQAMKGLCEDPKIRPDRKIELLLGILDREMRLLGTAAPTKSIQAHVSAGQLDPLYLDIRGVLQDLEEGDQQTALGLLREFAATKTKPITLDSKQLEGHNETDTYFS
jgi:hypothetical protein